MASITVLDKKSGQSLEVGQVSMKEEQEPESVVVNIAVEDDEQISFTFKGISLWLPLDRIRPLL